MGIKSLDLIPHRSFPLQVGTRTNLSNMTVTVAQADTDELPVNATISIENDIGLQPAQRKNPLARRNPFNPNPVPPSALGAELSVYLDESESYTCKHLKNATHHSLHVFIVTNT